MNIPKRKIETRAVGELKALVNKHPTMEEHITESDKGICWDGYINIFKNNNSDQDKRNFDAEVPVQVKGHIDTQKRYIGKERIKCSVSIADLEAYFRDKGCLYFVVYMSEDNSESEIFYRCLYPSFIKSVLKRAKKKANKKTFSIAFNRLDKNPAELCRVCRQFSNEIRREGSGLGQIVSHMITGDNVRRIKEMTIHSVGGSPYSLLKDISHGNAVLYGKYDGDIWFPVDADRLVAFFKEKIALPISINGHTYYDSYKQKITVVSPDSDNLNGGLKLSLKLSENLRFYIKPNEKLITFNFEFRSSLLQLKHDAEFVLDLLKYKVIEVGNNSICTDDIKAPDSFTKELIDVILLEDTLLDIGLKIEKPLKDFSDKEITQVNYLLRRKKEDLRNDSSIAIDGFIWTFGEKAWPVVVDYRSNMIQLYSLFTTRIVVSEGDQNKSNAYKNVVPNFSFLQPDVLAHLYYYDFRIMYDQIDQSSYNEITSSYLNICALHLISAYDLSQENQFLEMADVILTRIIKKLPDFYQAKVNEFQIEVRRTGCLSEDSNRQLDKILKIEQLKKTENNKISDFPILAFCVAVLKSQKEKADNLYSTLTVEQRKIVDNWPIQTLNRMLLKEKNLK